MPGNSVRFEKSMSQGHDAAWDQDWKRAASFYRQALEEFPDHPKALTSLGLALYELQDYAQSLKVYQRAAEVAPEDAISLERVGELLERSGNPEQAVEAYLKSAEIFIRTKDVNKGIELWQRVVQVKPDHLFARSRLALVYERLGKKSESMLEYLVVAGIFQHGGEVQKALQAINQAQQVAPGAPEPQQAIQMLKSGRLLPKPSAARSPTGPRYTPPAAEKPVAADDAVASDILADARQKALGELAELLFEQMEDSDDELGRRDMQSLMTGGNSLGGQGDRTGVILHVSTAVDLQSRQQDVQAIEELEKALDAGLDHPAAFFSLGYLYAQVMRYESAVRFLQKALNNPQYELGAHLLLGQTLLKMDRQREAAEELLSALKFADMLIVPAEQAEALGRMYDPLIEAQAQQPDVGRLTGLCENILEWLTKPNWRSQLERAREQLGGAEAGMLMPLADLLSESRGLQVVETLAQIQKLSRIGKPRSAVEEAYFAMEAAPTYLPLHIAVGELLLQQGLNAEAAEKFSVVARAYGIRGDLNQSVSLYRKIVELSPMDMTLRTQLIDLLVSHGRLEDAVSEYLRLADIHYSLADLVMTRKSLEEAEKLGQQGVSRSLRMKLFSRMADIDMQSLDWRQALRSYEQMRLLDPEDGHVRTTLIDLNFRLGQGQQALTEMNAYITALLDRKQYKPALGFLESLLETHPKQPAVLRMAAEVNRRMGNIEVAVAQLDLAGEMFLEGGNKAAAAETIITILSLNPPNAAEYQKILAQLRAGA